VSAVRILLINPDAPNIARIGASFEVKIGEIGRFPPIGLIALAAYLRANHGHTVKVLDTVARPRPLEALLEEARRFRPDVLGISTFTYTFYDALALARRLKAEFPTVPIVVGGPHTSLFATETLAHPEIDYLIIGEGEEPFSTLLDSLQAGTPPPAVGGLAFRTAAGLHIGAPAMVENLDALPIPAYDLLEEGLYYSTIGSGGKTITLNSSRGCPYKCTFCQVLVKGYRAHSIDYLLRYIRHFYDKGYRNFYFFDDLFNITKARIIEFSERLLEAGLDISWIFRGRVDQLDDEVCRVAARAGCGQVLLGVEDYTDEGLAAIRKGITIGQAASAIKAAARHGITTSTNWIIGLPTHKGEQDLEGLVQRAIDLGGDYAMFSILQLLPGCAIYNEAVAEGSYPEDAWRNFVLNPVPHFQIPFYDKHISGEPRNGTWPWRTGGFTVGPRTSSSGCWPSAAFRNCGGRPAWA